MMDKFLQYWEIKIELRKKVLEYLDYAEKLESLGSREPEMIERVERKDLKELMEETANNFVDTYSLFRDWQRLKEEI